MDTQRLLLVVALSFLLLLMWQQWQIDYGEPAGSDGSIPSATEPTLDPPLDVPEAAPPDTDAVTETAQAPGVPAANDAGLERRQRVRVETDLFSAEIDTYGGDLRTVLLKEYPVSVEQPDHPFELMSDTLPNLFVAQSGLIASQGSAPNHHAVYVPEQMEYALTEGQDQLVVGLTWAEDGGVEVHKSYVFTRGSYLIEVRHDVRNAGTEPWRGREYRQLQRTQVAESGNAFIYTYMGGAIYTPDEKYEKVDFAEMTDEDLGRDSGHGWAAMLQHYFLGAWVPAAEQVNHYYTKVLPGSRYLIGLVSPAVEVATGANHVFQTSLYVGPKLQYDLAAIAPGLDLTVDYGMLTVIAQPLFWLLTQIHAVVGNWGWSILLVTLVIKIVFYKLSETSYKSMANMRRMQPRMQAIKERFGDDKQKMNQALMELYKTEKINPLGGCLPIAVQIPVFIALYWVLLESVELRQAPFIFWIKDLSVEDPYYILPLIMGITMFLQQRLNPAPMDPIQQKVMMVLPVVFTVFFAFFPAGLVLYWVANNILSIAQQWMITKRIEQAAARKN